MNQRRLEHGERMIPTDMSADASAPVKAKEAAPERVIFDKADFAEKLEQLRAERDSHLVKIKELEDTLKTVDEDAKTVVETDIDQRKSRILQIESILETVSKLNTD